MSETLFAAVIGGLIASFVPFIALCKDYRKWRLEKKLEYLRAERSRLEKVFSGTLEELEGDTRSSMEYSIAVFMPKDVWDQVNTYMSEKEQSTKRLELAKTKRIMNETLSDIDKKIEKLMDI